ncbi:MAG: thiolase family protein [Alphaproteobacteria bacterium]|nr:thiolase family protein [Alphaproteobacteria bacterium]
MSGEVWILEGARTPTGRFLGGLSRLSPTVLGATAARGALSRAGVDPAAVQACFVGNVLQSAPDSVYVARHVGLDAGLPVEAPALTVNRACASGLEAIVQAAKAIRLGEVDWALAAGAENMSMTPYAMRGVREGWRMIKSQVDDILFTALHDPKAGCSIGETVEHLAAELGIDRAAADARAVASQARAAAAREAGVHTEEIVPVTLPKGRGVVSEDETLRPDTSLEGLRGLRGLYRPDGVVTAGNSSGLNDAGAAVVLASPEAARAEGLAPIGRVLAWGAVGVAPLRMGLGPVEASRLALRRAGLSLDDIDLVELNDSFTVQALAAERALGLDPERVNVNGGAIALGHPMGATGVRLALAALYALRRRGGRLALCAVCVGGGQGAALIVEAL